MRHLRQLHHIHRRPLLAVLDRLNVHRAAARKLYQRGSTWLDVKWLPAYAPDLNPVEALWSHAKYSPLANFVPDDVDQLYNALGDVHFRPQLMHSFFHAAKLQLQIAQSRRRVE